MSKGSISAVLLALCVAASGHAQEPSGGPSHTHVSHVAPPATAAVPPFEGTACPDRDPQTRADMTALGVIERCADIDVLPNSGGFRLATYLRVDAARAQAKVADGIVVETAPGRATFRVPDRVEFTDYTICNLDRTVRSEVPRSGRFRPQHGWVYTDARTASYYWVVKARVAQGATAPHLRVLAYFTTIPIANLAAGIDRHWCVSTAALETLKATPLNGQENHHEH